jgi:hypothetical protein
MILLLGLGRTREYSYLRIRELAPYLFKTLEKLKPSHICISLPFNENYHVDCGKLVEVLLEGIVDALDSNQSPLNQGWISGLSLRFAEDEDQFHEILLGVQTAQSILEDRLQIRILIPSEKKIL